MRSMASSSANVVQVQNVLKKVLVLSLGVICSVIILLSLREGEGKGEGEGEGGSYTYFSCSFVVGLWNSVRCFLSCPLYICIIINSMVLLIALLSKPPQPHNLLSTTEKTSTPNLYHHHHLYLEPHDQVTSNDKHLEEEEEETEAEDQVSSSEEEEEEEDNNNKTMEATWKAISGAKLTKSQTFIQETAAAHLKKSETFKETVWIRRRGGMRRDPSVGIDEFNEQVEAFINKFNNDMRLQRQLSDQRFIDMINRGL